MAGGVTGIIFLALHLFWKFQTANSVRGKWKTVFPVAWLPRQCKKIQEVSICSRLQLNLVSRRIPTQIYQITNYRRRNCKYYVRRAA